MVRSDKAAYPREICRIRSICRCTCIQMQRFSRPVIGKRQRIRTATSNIGVIPSRGINQIISRTAGNTVTACAALDRIAVIGSYHLRDVAQRICRIACRRSGRQINIRRHRRIRKIYRVAAAATINRIATRRRINQIIATTARDAVTARTTGDRITQIAAHDRRKVAKRITPPTRRRSCRQINRLRRCRIREVDCIRSSTAIQGVTSKSSKYDVIPRSAGNTVITRTARDRVAVARSYDIREVADRICRIARRRSARQIDRRRHRRIGKVQCIRSANTAVQRITARTRIEQVASRSTQHAITAVGSIDRVTMVRSDKAGNTRKACRIRSIRR